MKKEWKPEELRATSEEIRGAVMPKTITPEMVGGTLAGLTDALGEVVEVLGEIPREHVTVKVRGYDGTGGVSGAGAKVLLNVFAVGGYPTIAIPQQELTADADGVVKFDVPIGFKYAVSSHIDGLGASFQLVYEAVTEKRDITLWNFLVGVWALGHTDVALYADEEAGRDYDHYRAIPFISSGMLIDDFEDAAGVVCWDIDADAGEVSEGSWYIGVLISTAETTFAIGRNSLSDGTMMWCDSRDRNTVFPLMNYYALDRNAVDWDYDASVEQARADMDGNMNTAKILGFSPTHIAARWAAASESDYDEEKFLPSAGQLYTMWLNRTAINAIVQQYIDNGDEGFTLLPYQNDKGQWQLPNDRSEYWWSSSVLDKRCSWVVYYNGNITNDNRHGSNDVRAVSAFHFEY